MWWEDLVIVIVVDESMYVSSNIRQHPSLQLNEIIGKMLSSSGFDWRKRKPEATIFTVAL